VISTFNQEYRLRVIGDHDKVEVRDVTGTTVLSIDDQGRNQLIVLDANAETVLRIRRLRRFPKIRFEIASLDHQSCFVTSNFTRTSYSICFINGVSLEFRAPLFRSDFCVMAQQGCVAQVRALRENAWALRSSEDTTSVALLAALGYVLRSRWRST
jgi:hypothetical protein